MLEMVAETAREKHTATGREGEKRGRQLMKTKPQFPDAFESSTLLICPCLAMLCMLSPAAIMAINITYHAN